MTPTIDSDVPPLKKTQTRGSKRKQSSTSKKNKFPKSFIKKYLITTRDDDPVSLTDKDCIEVSEENLCKYNMLAPVYYYQVNELWKRSVCARIPELQFISRFVCVPGGNDVILTRPHKHILEVMVIVSTVPSSFSILDFAFRIFNRRTHGIVHTV